MEVFLGLKQSALSVSEQGWWLLLAFAFGVAAGWTSWGSRAGLQAEPGGTDD